MRINDPRIETTIQGAPVMFSVCGNMVYCYSRPVALGKHRLMRLLIFSPPASIRLIYDVFGNSVAIASFSKQSAEVRTIHA